MDGHLAATWILISIEWFRFFLLSMKKLLTSLIAVLFAGNLFAQMYHDAALFEVFKGIVDRIEYPSGNVCFFSDGRIDKNSSTYLSQFSKYEIERDNEGYPIKLVTEYDETVIEYDSFHYISKKIITGVNKNVEMNYSRSNSNISISINSLESGQRNTSIQLYDNINWDYMDNWISLGTRGTKVPETKIWREYSTAGDVIGSVNWETTEKYVGGKVFEHRQIIYREENDMFFTKPVASNEVTLSQMLEEPFFLGIPAAQANDKILKKALEKAGYKLWLRKNHYPKYKKLSPNKYNDHFRNNQKSFYGLPLLPYLAYNNDYQRYSVYIRCEDNMQMMKLLNFLRREFGDKSVTVSGINTEYSYKYKNSLTFSICAKHEFDGLQGGCSVIISYDLNQKE